MANGEVKIGQKLRSSREMKTPTGTVMVGEVVTVNYVENIVSCQNFKCEEYEDYLFPHQAFEHVVKPEKKRTAFEVEQLDGWLNIETYHAALVIYNDYDKLRKLDANIKTKGPLRSVVGMTSRLDLPSGMSRDKVDTWSIQFQRAKHLHDEGVIDGSQLNHWIGKLDNIGSATCKRRLKLLKEEGFDTTDRFFDHEAAMKQEALPVEADITLTINREEQNMRQNKFETKTFINGTDIKNFDASAQGQFIVDNDAEIARLEGFSVKTKAITKQIKQLKADNKQAVELFDSVNED